MWAELRLRARALKYRYRLDRAELAFLRACVAPGHIAVDLGAHKGAYTYWLAKAVGSTGRVLAVEPQPLLAARLRSLMASRSQVVVHGAAASDATAEGTLSLAPNGSSHAASIAGFPDGRVGPTVTVPTITLADLVSTYQLPRVDFIKCDIEGHEARVFSAATELLRAWRPVILCECEERHAVDERGGVDGLRRVMEPCGYRMSFFYRRELLPVEQFDAAIHQRVGHAHYGNNFVLWCDSVRRGL